MTATETFKIKRGDLEPPLRISCTRDGEPVDLTEAEAVAVVLSPRRRRSPVVRREATGNSEGVVTYAWALDDTDTVAMLDVEVEVTWPGGRPETFPDDTYLTVEVVADLG